MTHPYNPRARARFTFTMPNGELLGVCDCTGGRAKALAREYSKAYEADIRFEALPC